METVIEVAKDIYQVESPLPFALNSVNCYLLRDDDGWTILDTGLNTPAARAVWQAAFASLDISPEAIGRIVLTHSHPDHYGLAGWLQELCGGGEPASGPPVLMSPREAELARLVWAQQDGWFERLFDYFTCCGVPEELIASTISGIDQVRARTRPHPRIVEMLEPGSTMHIGGRDFQVLLTPGHSDGQLVFYDAGDRLLLCGDHVLQNITPNISLWPQTEADPLGRYLASVRQLASLEVRLALPGHRARITDWQGRLAELETHHAARLERMAEATGADGGTPYEVSAKVFDFDLLTSHEARFAVAETLAHLEYLVVQKELYLEDNGVWRYRRG